VLPCLPSLSVSSLPAKASTSFQAVMITTNFQTRNIWWLPIKVFIFNFTFAALTSNTRKQILYWKRTRYYFLNFIICT
jgi:hypothetical protein